MNWVSLSVVVFADLAMSFSDRMADAGGMSEFALSSTPCTVAEVLMNVPSAKSELYTTALNPTKQLSPTMHGP